MSSSDKLKKVLAAVAPALGAAVGGPFGGIAGKFLADKLGNKDADTPAEQLALVQAAIKDPQKLLELKQIDKDFEKFALQNGLDLYRAEIDDRKDARANMAALKSKTPAALSWLIVLGFFGVTGYLLGWGTPEGLDPMLLGRLLGNLDTAFGMVLAFWLGSSHGSRAKDVQK